MMRGWEIVRRFPDWAILGWSVVSVFGMYVALAVREIEQINETKKKELGETNGIDNWR